MKRDSLPPSWFERNARTIGNGVGGVCALLLVVDVVFQIVGHKHTHFDVEGIPGFYALAGFLSYVGLVLTAKQLRKVLKRPEDFYGEAPLEDQDGLDHENAEGGTSAQHEEEE